MNFEKKIPTRNGFGDEIVALGKENRNILVVDADIGKSCKTGDFRKALPEQYLNVGIAEQNCAGVAAGLATCGKIPFVVTYAAFGSMRMCEMIRQEIAYPHLNVKIACSHGGVTPANDGASHQAIEDMGILRTIPNMTVIMPADYNAARRLASPGLQIGPGGRPSWRYVLYGLSYDVSSFLSSSPFLAMPYRIVASTWRYGKLLLLIRL